MSAKKKRPHKKPSKEWERPVIVALDGKTYWLKDDDPRKQRRTK